MGSRAWKRRGEGIPVLRERPLGVLAADPRGLLGDPAPRDERVGKGLANLRRLHGAAAKRNQAAAAERLEGMALLGLPKPRLAVAGEDLCHRLSQLALDLRVDVGGLGAEHRRRALRRARLAGSHEADERDRSCFGPSP